MPSTINARIGDGMKRRFDAYCTAAGISLTSAVVDGVEAAIAHRRLDPDFAARMDAILSGLPPR